MGGRREVSIISRRPVTSSDLKQERSFFFPRRFEVSGVDCTCVLVLSNVCTYQSI